ncbi:DUF4861 family protein [Bacteroidota bacterium]
MKGFITFFLLLLFSAGYSQHKTSASMYLNSNKNQQLDSVYSKSGDLYQKLGHHGPAIENQWYGLRLYFNKKTAIDVYSKAKPGLELLKKKWYPSRKEQFIGWGADYYKVGNTVGLGGIKLWNGEGVTDLNPVIGRSAWVFSEMDSSYLIMLSEGVPYLNTTIDIYIRVIVYADSRLAKVEAWTKNGEPVQFVTGINYFKDLKIKNEDSYIATWGIHPEDVAAEKKEIGAAIILNQSDMDQIIDDGNQYLYITKPVSKISFSISSANEREPEINSYDRFVANTEELISAQRK